MKYRDLRTQLTVSCARRPGRVQRDLLTRMIRYGGGTFLFSWKMTRAESESLRRLERSGAVGLVKIDGCWVYSILCG